MHLTSGPTGPGGPGGPGEHSWLTGLGFSSTSPPKTDGSSRLMASYVQTIKHNSEDAFQISCHTHRWRRVCCTDLQDLLASKAEAEEGRAAVEVVT